MAPWGAIVFATVAGTSVLGVAAAPLLVPAAVGALGFGAGGITAGTWAAGLMSSYAGAVPAGSLCAVLQSVGAAGLGTSTVVAVEGAATSIAAASTAMWYSFFKKATPADPEDAEKKEDTEDGEKGKPADDEGKPADDEL